MLILLFSKKENTKEEGRKKRKEGIKKRKEGKKEGREKERKTGRKEKKRGSPLYCESILRYFYLNENISYYKYLYSMHCLDTYMNYDRFQ